MAHILPRQKFRGLHICTTLHVIFHHLFSENCQYFTYGERKCLKKFRSESNRQQRILGPIL